MSNNNIDHKQGQLHGYAICAVSQGLVYCTALLAVLKFLKILNSGPLILFCPGPYDYVACSDTKAH